MSVFSEDFFAAEPPLLDRLRDKVAGARAVLSAADLEEVQEKSQITPAVHVVFHGFSLVGDEIEQTWLVVAVAKNLRQPTAAAGSAPRINSEAGRLVAKIVNGLRGHTLFQGGQCDPLMPVNAPGAIIQNGFVYVPTAWSLKFRFTRERP